MMSSQHNWLFFIKQSIFLSEIETNSISIVTEEKDLRCNI